MAKKKSLLSKLIKDLNKGLSKSKTNPYRNMGKKKKK